MMAPSEAVQLEAKLQGVRHKIEIEKKVLNGANAMLRSLTSKSARDQCESNAIESQRRLDFLDSELRRVQHRQMQLATMQKSEHPLPPIPTSPEAQSSSSGAPAAGHAPHDHRAGHGQLADDLGFGASSRTNSGMQLMSGAGSRIHSSAGSSESLSQMGHAPMRPSDSAAAQGPQPTHFDYLKYGTALTTAKVKFRLEAVRKKLHHEQRMKAGSESMRHASADGKVRADMDDSILDYVSKIAFLQKSDQRYKSLYVEDDLFENKEDEHAEVKDRRTGRLRVRVIGATNLPSRRSNTPLICIVKVDGIIKHVTKSSRTRWDELIDTQIDKASEVEISVRERGGSLMGLVWWSIGDLEDECRTKNITNDTNRGEGEENWLDLEPAGQILIKCRFEPITRGSTMAPGGAFRRGQVQKAYPKNGHKFLPVSYYQPMQCAVCTEFLGRQAYQCDRCEYIVHKDCWKRVITQCVPIAQGGKHVNTGALLKYNIPHRLESTTTLVPTWCGHCGSIVPPGRKHMRCTECSRTAHRDCAGVLPPFCGLQPEMADTLRQAFEDYENQRTRLEMEAAEKDRYKNEVGDRGDFPVSSIPSTAENGIEQQMGSMRIDLGPAEGLPSLENLQHHPGAGDYDHSGVLDASFENEPLSPADFSKTQYSLDLDMSGPPKPQHHGQHLQEIAPPMATPSHMTAPPNHNYPVAPPRLVAVNTGGSSPLLSHKPANMPTSASGRSSATSRPQGSTGMRPAVKMDVSLDDFEFLAVLGRGAFGKVMLAAERKTKALYAIKALKKEFICQNDDVKSTKLEKRIFQAASAAHHPYLVNLHSSFQTTTRIYFAMEYVSGGDLMAHIMEKKKFNAQRTKFYACEVLLALEYFHKNDIIYRDLKLDNILMAPDGHIKVADYGICKEHMPYGQTTRTFCGTPDYMAPEVLNSSRYSRAVDWWSFGVLIYVMLVGKYPFHGEDERDVLDAIERDQIDWPSGVSKETTNLLQGLLTKNPAKRLGGGRHDAAEIKRHPYFAGIDWQAYADKRVPPPWIPVISHPTDVSNFDPEFTREQPVLTPITTEPSAADQSEFRGFEYVSDWAMQARQLSV